jgi:hypothetical protein
MLRLLAVSTSLIGSIFIGSRCRARFSPPLARHCRCLALHFLLPLEVSLPEPSSILGRVDDSVVLWRGRGVPRLSDRPVRLPAFHGTALRVTVLRMAAARRTEKRFRLHVCRETASAQKLARPRQLRLMASSFLPLDRAAFLQNCIDALLRRGSTRLTMRAGPGGKHRARHRHDAPADNGHWLPARAARFSPAGSERCRCDSCCSRGLDAVDPTGIFPQQVGHKYLLIWLFWQTPPSDLDGIRLI